MKKEFRLEDYERKFAFALHCDTLEKARIMCFQLIGKAYWGLVIELWNKYKKEACFSFGLYRELECNSKLYFQKHNCVILEFDDFEWDKKLTLQEYVNKNGGFASQDKNGDRWAYPMRPEMDEDWDEWFSNDEDDEDPLEITNSTLPFDGDWKDSLCESNLVVFKVPNYMPKQLYCEATGQSWDRVDHLDNGWCEYKPKEEEIYKEKEMSVDKRRKMFFNSFVGMYENLNDEVHKAGGSGFSLDRLNEMSAADLLECLATNNIRFVFKKEE